MLNAIREFFDQHVAAGATGGDERHTIEVATAALLVETVRLDGEIDAAERAAAHRAVRAKFGLGEAEAATLIRLAEEEARDATDYYQFTSLINQHFSAEQRQRVIELMWQVAYADAELSAHEQHVVRKIAESPARAAPRVHRGEAPGARRRGRLSPPGRLLPQLAPRRAARRSGPVRLRCSGCCRTPVQSSSAADSNDVPARARSSASRPR